MRRTTTTTLALTAAAALTLSACGGGGTGALTQEQTAEVLLTQEEFPVADWTRGEVEEMDEDEDSGTEGTNDFEEMLTGAEGVSQECIDSLGAVEEFDSEAITAGSKVAFTGPESDSLLGAGDAELVVAAIDGDSPLTNFDAINQHCDEVTIEQDGLSMTMTFSSLDGLDGTKIGLDVMGQSIEMIMGGTTEGENVVAVMGMGLTEEEVKQIVDLQVGKISDLG